MSGNVALGLAVVVLAGVLQGSFAAPMKRMSAWRWENSWLLFALSGLVISPWIINFATVPHVLAVYSAVSSSTLIKVAAFGLLWGAGSTLFGLGIARVGLALGFALILGITASFGSLVPMAILHPEELLLKRGIALILGTIVMTLGLISLAFAGRTRERDLGETTGRASDFTIGLLICVFAGIFSSMMNFAFVFGDELRLRALHSGASNAMAANPIWALTVSVGFIANFSYCVYLLNKNHTWGLFGMGNTSLYWLLGSLTGLLWFGGTVLYGTGAAAMGVWGSIIGWPIFITLDIIVGLFWGAVSGEWKGASRLALIYNWVGVGVLLLAIGVISAGNAS
jgi:L-rhamnose-H+ transport protein